MTARIYVTGNAATAPLVRVTRTGRKVANFRIASTERHQDRETGDWVDGNTFFVSVACWGALADNVEQSVRLGMGLVVTGKISQRTYTDAQDKVQFSYEIHAESVAPDLNRATAVVTRTTRTAGPSVTLGEDGHPVVGVSDEPFQPTGVPVGSAAPDAFTMRPDGSFTVPADVEPAVDDDEFGRPGEGDREPSELVGAAG